MHMQPCISQLLFCSSCSAQHAIIPCTACRMLLKGVQSQAPVPCRWGRRRRTCTSSGGATSAWRPALGSSRPRRGPWTSLSTSPAHRPAGGHIFETLGLFCSPGGWRHGSPAPGAYACSPLRCRAPQGACCGCCQTLSCCEQRVEGGGLPRQRRQLIVRLVGMLGCSRPFMQLCWLTANPVVLRLCSQCPPLQGFPWCAGHGVVCCHTRP